MTQHLRNYQDRSIRLTDERLAHILRHPEMAKMNLEIARVLQQPGIVCRSKSDWQTVLYYRYYEQTMVGAKWLCVVVKDASNNPFIITAYLTDKIKQGEILWGRL